MTGCVLGCRSVPMLDSELQDSVYLKACRAYIEFLEVIERRHVVLHILVVRPSEGHAHKHHFQVLNQS